MNKHKTFQPIGSIVILVMKAQKRLPEYIIGLVESFDPMYKTSADFRVFSYNTRLLDHLNLIREIDPSKATDSWIKVAFKNRHITEGSVIWDSAIDRHVEADDWGLKAI